MPLALVMLIVVLAAGGGVATALFVVPPASEAIQAISAQTLYGELDEDEPPPEAETPTSDDAAVAGPDELGDEHEQEPEIPVGDEEVPEPEDPEDELERAPALALPDAERVPANPELRLDAFEIEIVDGERPWVLHKLTPFETISQVAHRYDVQPSTVRTHNGLSSEVETLKPGSRLKVKAHRVPPPRRRIEYTVQPGDTWWSIAVAHGIDSKELRAANWSAPRRLTVGESLKLWIDPAVYHWIQTDRPALEDEDLLANIRRGAVSIGPAWDGRLINGVQVPPGEGWRRKMLPSCYGTTHAVIHLVAALQQFHATSGYERDLLLGSMSRRHGGPLVGHRSHQTGRDIDIRLPLSTEHPPWFPIKPWRVDYQALWTLLVALADTGEVSIVFLDYGLQKLLHKAALDMGVEESVRRRMIQWPRGDAAHLGLVRHSSGHEAHIHVRFRCGPHETECVTGSGWSRDEG